MSKTNTIVALNYIYLSEHHAGGKDQVALNLLQGIVSNGDADHYIVFCYDYSVDIIKKYAPDIQIEVIRSSGRHNELFRLWDIMRINTCVIPHLIKKHHVSVLFHVGYNNGLRKFKAESITLPHDIKAISHRVIGKIKIPMYKYILYRIMYYLDFSHADRIIAISDTDLKEMTHYYPRYQDKIVRIYNPIKVDLETAKKYYNEDQDKSGIVAINLQFHHKNVLTLIKAFEKIMDRIDDDLILIGNVPSRVDYLKKYVTEHELEDRVQFTGFLSGGQKRKILTSCRLYVNPSLFEGFGMTAVEAVILKVPTLLSKVSANYEVTKGLCNYYEPADSPDALAEAILKSISRDETQHDLEYKCSEMLHAYDYRVIAKEYVQLFEDVNR